ISRDWSSDVCSSDLVLLVLAEFVLHPQEVGGTTEVVEYAGPLVPGGDDGRRRTEHLVDLPQPQSSVGHLPQELQPGDVPPGQELLAAQRPSCRSEEHTSELQSRENLVCRLLLEKKKI